jgi:hypothetical protein
MFGLFKSGTGTGFGGVESTRGPRRAHPAKKAPNGKENRRARRFPPRDIKVRLDGKQLDLVDISGTGVFIRNAPGWLAAGQALVFEIVIPINGEQAFIATHGRIARKTNDGIAVNYRAPHPNWGKMLAKYLS